MLPHRVQCPGCERQFSNRGLSQHISKTKDKRCRDAVFNRSAAQHTSSSIRDAPKQPLGNPKYPLVSRDASKIADVISGSEDYYSDDSLDSAAVADADVYEELLRIEKARQAASTDSPWTPFHSELDWNVARWARKHASGNAVAELLAIPGLVDALGLSFRTVKELNEKIDACLFGRPHFR